MNVDSSTSVTDLLEALDLINFKKIKDPNFEIRDRPTCGGAARIVPLLLLFPSTLEGRR